MSITFRMKPHMVHGDRLIVEVWDDKGFIAAIYPDEHGLKVVSKHPMSATMDEETYPPAIKVAIGRLQ